MDFLKKHYEKVLLGVVLCALGVGAVFLIFMIPAERAKLDDRSREIINRPPKPLPPLDLSPQELLLTRLQTPLKIDLATTNKVFNPMVWRKRPPPENTPIKDVPRNIGPEAVVVTRIAPLHLVISLDSVTPSDAGARYVMGVERETAANPASRKKKIYYATLNNKNDTFILREVKGDANNPAELTVELNDTSERVTVAKDRPFRRVDGYTADLKYQPENNKTWLGQRKDAPIKIEGQDYNIVAIKKDEVILSARANDKKTSIPYNAGP